MPDVEKVISDLEEQITWIRDNDFHKFPGWGHAVLAMRDALALLKAQEPCEDAVSRKDVINVLQSPCDMRYVYGNWHPCIGDYIEAITSLSAVAPKAQEPVEPVMVNGEHECGACRYELRADADSYCPCCGRKVKWE